MYVEDFSLLDQVESNKKWRKKTRPETDDKRPFYWKGWKKEAEHVHNKLERTVKIKQQKNLREKNTRNDKKENRVHASGITSREREREKEK